MSHSAKCCSRECADQCNEKLVLGYWAVRGRGQAIRYALEYAKVPYVDKTYGGPPDFNPDSWFGVKETLGFDFPNLPYLIDGDLKLTQSMAIVLYIGRKYHLMGKNIKEEGTVMMLCQQISDYREALNRLGFSPQGAIEEERRKFVQTTLTDTLKRFEKYLAKTNTKFAVGNNPTMADFQIFEHFAASTPLEGARELIGQYPNVHRIIHAVRELPEIKDYITKIAATRPFSSQAAAFGGTVLEEP